MTLKKTLTSIALATTLTLGISGCYKDYSEYRGTYKIDNKIVEFLPASKDSGGIHTLIVDSSETKTTYNDLNHDLKFDYAMVRENATLIATYENNSEKGMDFLNKGNKYVHKIMDGEAEKFQPNKYIKPMTKLAPVDSQPNAKRGLKYLLHRFKETGDDFSKTSTIIKKGKSDIQQHTLKKELTE